MFSVAIHNETTQNLDPIHTTIRNHGFCNRLPDNFRTPFGPLTASTDKGGTNSRPYNPTNEDGYSVFIDSSPGSPRLQCWVADGLSFPDGGSLASSLVLESTATSFRSHESLTTSFEYAGTYLRDFMKASLFYMGDLEMKTTAFGIEISSDEYGSPVLHGAYRGDSKLLVVRDDQVLFETLPHNAFYTMLQQKLDQQKVPDRSKALQQLKHELGASYSPSVGMVSNLIGLYRGDLTYQAHTVNEENPLEEISPLPLEHGDWIILGSDGFFLPPVPQFSSELTNEDIISTLQKVVTPSQAQLYLRQLVVEKGELDHVTLAVMRVDRSDRYRQDINDAFLSF